MAKKKMTCSVCGSDVKQDSQFKADYKGRMYYFCSKNDMKEFEKRPQVYAGIERVSNTGRAA